MKEKTILSTLLLILLLLIIYIFIIKIFNIIIPCPINHFFHIDCPGCGLTRMFLSLLDGNIYSSFRYNMFMFLLLPIIFILFIDLIISIIIKKDSLIIKMPKYIYVVVLIFSLLFGIFRNII